MITEHWIAPSPEEGWDRWRSEADRILPATGSLAPAKGETSTVMLPISAIRFSLERVFKGEDEAEYLTVITAAQANAASKRQEGQLDAWKISSDEQFSYYCRVLLEETTAERAWIDCHFDILARALIAETEIIFWKEHNRWVFACFKDSTLIHADVLAPGELLPQISNLLPLLQIYFSTSGIDFTPDRAVVYSPQEEDAGLHETSLPLPCPVEVRTGPLELKKLHGHLPIVPEEVETWRKERTSDKRRMVIGLAASVVLLIATLALFLRMYLVEREIGRLEAQIEEHRAVVAMNNELLGKWNELSGLTSDYWPLDSYAAVAEAIPRALVVQLTSLEIRPGFVSVRGKSPTFGPANAFGSNLQKAPEFAEFEWTNRPPTESPEKTWVFRYEGTLNQEETP